MTKYRLALIFNITLLFLNPLSKAESSPRSGQLVLSWSKLQLLKIDERQKYLSKISEVFSKITPPVPNKKKNKNTIYLGPIISSAHANTRPLCIKGNKVFLGTISIYDNTSVDCDVKNLIALPASQNSLSQYKQNVCYVAGYFFLGQRTESGLDCSNPPKGLLGKNFCEKNYDRCGEGKITCNPLIYGFADYNWPDRMNRKFQIHMDSGKKSYSIETSTLGAGLENRPKLYETPICVDNLLESSKLCSVESQRLVTEGLKSEKLGFPVDAANRRVNSYAAHVAIMHVDLKDACSKKQGETLSDMWNSFADTANTICIAPNKNYACEQIEKDASLFTAQALNQVDKVYSGAQSPSTRFNDYKPVNTGR